MGCAGLRVVPVCWVFAVVFLVLELADSFIVVSLLVSFSSSSLLIDIGVGSVLLLSFRCVVVSPLYRPFAG